MDPSQKEHMKLLRLKFSVRTLAIFVTLVCAYFGAWETTKRYAKKHYQQGIKDYGDDDKALMIKQTTAPLPLLVVRKEVQYEFLPNATFKREYRVSYYLWLLGPKVKLPFESTWDSAAQ
jgi:hypothetical protein